MSGSEGFWVPFRRDVGRLAPRHRVHGFPQGHGRDAGEPFEYMSHPGRQCYLSLHAGPSPSGRLGSRTTDEPTDLTIGTQTQPNLMKMSEVSNVHTRIISLQSTTIYRAQPGLES